MQSLPCLYVFTKERKIWNCHQHTSTTTSHFSFYKWRRILFLLIAYIPCIYCNNTLFRLDSCKLQLMRKMQSNLKTRNAQPQYVILFIVRGNVTVIQPFLDPRDRSYCEHKIALQLSISIVSQWFCCHVSQGHELKMNLLILRISKLILLFCCTQAPFLQVCAT